MYGYADLRKSQLPFQSWEKVRRAVGRVGPGGMGKGRLWSNVPSCAEDLELNPTGDEMNSTTGKCTVWVIKIMSSHPTNPKHTTPFKRIGIGHMEVLTREMNG